MAQSQEAPPLKGSGKRARTPTILQVEATECGAASLAMVMASHGLWMTLDDLREECGVSRDGSRAGSLMRAARNHGFEARGFRAEPPALRDMPMPAILFVNSNHFLVLEGFGKDRVFLNDPAGGRRQLSPAEFDRIYSGIILTFTRGPAFKRGGCRPPVLPRLALWLAGDGDSITQVLISGLILALFGVVAPSFTQIFIDDYLVQNQTDWVPGLLAAMVATASVLGAVVWLKSGFSQRMTARIHSRAAAKFLWTMLRLPISFYSRRYPGSVGARLEMVNGLSEEAMTLGTVVPGEIATILIFLLIMQAYSVLLTALAAFIASVNVILFIMTRRRLELVGQKAALDETRLLGRTMLGLQMIETLKSSGTDDPFFVAWAGQQSLVATAHQERGRLGALLTVVPEFLAQFGAVGTLILGGWQIMHGQLTLGMLMGFQLLQAAFNAPVRSLVQAGLQIQLAQGTLDQLDDVLSQPISREFDERAPGGSGRAQRLSGQVELAALAFGYGMAAPPLIEDLTLAVPAGSRIAIVGGSGSGKSTLGRLVSGQFDPWQGRISFDGTPMDQVPRHLLRNSIAVVDQDIVLFEGSIRDNITLWDDTVPEATIVRAATDARIHDVIVTRPGGYAGAVQEGGRNFSGGQRQRIEIARALVGNPTLLILDEATSALDPVTEQEVMDNLRQRGCTCVIIAHRLSTIRDCDEIIVMERGKIVERGTHDALMSLQGAYARLVDF